MFGGVCGSFRFCFYMCVCGKFLSKLRDGADAYGDNDHGGDDL